MRGVGGETDGGSGSAHESLLFLFLLLLLLLLLLELWVRLFVIGVCSVASDGVGVDAGPGSLLVLGVLAAGVVGVVAVLAWCVVGVVVLSALWRWDRSLPYRAQIGLRWGAVGVGLLGGVEMAGFDAVVVVGVLVVAVVVVSVIVAAVVVVATDVLAAVTGARTKYGASVGSQEGSDGHGSVGSKKAFTMACVVRVRVIAAVFAVALVVKVNRCRTGWVVVVSAFFSCGFLVVRRAAFFRARTLSLHLSLSAAAFCSASQLSSATSIRMSPCCLLLKMTFRVSLTWRSSPLQFLPIRMM